MLTLSLLLVSLLAAFAAAVTPPSQCTCGYRDAETQQLFTESLIVYFNETDAIDPEIFTLQSYAHKKEQGWNSVYRQGAKPENAIITNVTSIWPHVQALELQTDPWETNHTVNGGSLQTVRKDIQYGSFRAALKSADQWTGGTALSFQLRYNASQSLEMDFMNMDDPADAAVSNLVNGEWPADDILTNFTVLEAAGLDPWKTFTNVRMDWNKTNVAFYIADNKTRAETKKHLTLPLAGQPLELRSWSTGDQTWMEGPPSVNATKSHVLWVRAFFNSSTMSTAEHDTFDERCKTSAFCSTSDITLRGSTAYSPASTVEWKEISTDNIIRKLAGIVAAACSSFGIFALINLFIRRTPWDRLRPDRSDKTGSAKALRTILGRSLHDKPLKKTDEDQRSESSRDLGTSSSIANSGIQTPLPAYGTHTPRSGYQTPAPAYETPPRLPTPNGAFSPPLPTPNVAFRNVEFANASQTPASSHLNLPLGRSPTGTPSVQTIDEKDAAKLDRIEEAPRIEQDVEDHLQLQYAADKIHKHDQEQIQDPFSDNHAITLSTLEGKPITRETLPMAEKGKQQLVVTVTPLDEKSAAATNIAPTTAKLPPTKRVDYLAGLVAVACMGVTLHHFCQTFWPWVTDGYGPGAHYPKVEKWLSYFVGSYFLTQLWIGPFFLTATRFLSTNYFKNGNLEDIAKKELRRAPRLFVPIILISLMEYFLLCMDLNAALQWLPSISWSTWPYVVPQPNFGVYLNELFELAYLMPNAIPEIVSHYCIGVLWTVPVQLQFTYVVLTATVLIKDIKNPWKRFGFYTVMIVSGWYAKSWSSCHWAGLVLSDLETTYKWKTYLNKRPFALYAVMFGAFLAAFSAPLAACFNQAWSFETLENGIHPDFATGRPIMDVKPVYPGYNEPTLTIIMFSVGFQMLVELSTVVQALLSTKAVLWLHPHIMTVYLTHGFVMWTWGAWVTVQMGVAGVPYWANLLVNLITTYALIFLLATFLTPLIEFPTQAFMRNLDRWTKDEPVARRETTAPFSKELVVNRQGGDHAAGES